MLKLSQTGTKIIDLVRDETNDYDYYYQHFMNAQGDGYLTASPNTFVIRCSQALKMAACVYQEAENVPYFSVRDLLTGGLAALDPHQTQTAEEIHEDGGGGLGSASSLHCTTLELTAHDETTTLTLTRTSFRCVGAVSQDFIKFVPATTPPKFDVRDLLVSRRRPAHASHTQRKSPRSRR